MKDSYLQPRLEDFPIRAYLWNGKPIYYRAHSTDAVNLYKILLNRGKKGEYYLPRGLNPEVILDIGANTGIASLYFSRQYPSAKIYAFEPVPHNFRLLKKNIEGYGNILAFPFALGEEDGKFQMKYSSAGYNLGGFSFYQTGVEENKSVEVEKKNIKSYLPEIGIKKVSLIKIDTEGAEYEILHALDCEMLQSVEWIVGELHGIRDFEIMAYLSKFFYIQVKKAMKKRHFMFYAGNKKIMDTIRE
jgi:FkbM family methyltransferase